MLSKARQMIALFANLNDPNDPNDIEKIEIADISATGELLSIIYNHTKLHEKIEIADISATGVLTHIDDL